MSRFSLVDLQLFVNVIDAGSMTGGAERSHLSLSAASTRIKQLEENSGARLLVRGSRANATPAGEIVLKHAHRILSDLQHMKDELREFTGQYAGRVRVLANATSINPFLTSVLGRFLSTYPGMAIDLHECISCEAVKAVCTGSADVAIIAEKPADADLQAIPYRSEDLVLCASRTNRSVDVDMLTNFAAVSHQPQIMLHKSSALRQFLEKKASENGVALQCRIEVDNYGSMLDLIGANIGVGILPRYALSHCPIGTDLASVQLDDEWAKRTSFICFRPLQSVTTSTRELISMLLDSDRG